MLNSSTIFFCHHLWGFLKVQFVIFFTFFVRFDRRFLYVLNLWYSNSFLWLSLIYKNLLHILFLICIDVKIPAFSYGLLLVFISPFVSCLSGACLSISVFITCNKFSKDVSVLHFCIFKISVQFKLSNSYLNLVVLSFLWFLLYCGFFFSLLFMVTSE